MAGIWDSIPSDAGLHGIGREDAEQIFKENIFPEQKLQYPDRYISDVNALCVKACRRWAVPIENRDELKFYWYSTKRPMASLIVSLTSLDATQWEQPHYGCIDFLADEEGVITAIGVVYFTNSNFITVSKEEYDNARLKQ